MVICIINYEEDTFLILYIYPDIYPLVSFILFRMSKCPSGVISLQLEQLTFVFLWFRSSGSKFSKFYFERKMSLVCLPYWRISSLDIETWVDRFLPFSSLMMWFWFLWPLPFLMRSLWWLEFLFLYVMSFFLWLLARLSLYLWLLAVWIWVSM